MKNATGRVMVLALGIWFVAVFSAATALADSPAPSPDTLVSKPVDELIRLALENNPGIKVAEAQVQLAQAELVRQRAEVAMKVSEVMASWEKTSELGKQGLLDSYAAPYARNEAERELRLLTGAGVEKGPTTSISPAEPHKASLEMRIGRYGELTWEVKGLPIPEELRRGSDNTGRRYDEVISGMWWLQGPEVRATVVAPVDLPPYLVSMIWDALKEAKIESFSCVPTTEHMALPIVEENLGVIGEGLQHSFKEKATGKVGPSELEAFLKDFQIPTSNLKPTDREMTYRVELYVLKGATPNNLLIRVFAPLPSGAEIGSETVIHVEKEVPNLQLQQYDHFTWKPIGWLTHVETIFSKSVKVPATQPASER
jgi:hypothetical protein